MLTEETAVAVDEVTEPEEEDNEFVVPVEEEEDNGRKIFVNYVLDQSGSMEPVWEATIGGFNEYVNTLKEGKKDKTVLFSLTQFDSDDVYQPRFQRILEFVDLPDVELLTDEVYKPFGWTPLFDAVADTIHRTQARIDELAEDVKVLCVIQTDGLENASQEYTPDRIRHLIEQKTKEGWTFVYLGAGHDTWAQGGGTMGIPTGNIGTYTRSNISTQQAFRSAGAASAAYVANAGVQTKSFYADAGVDQDMTETSEETKEEESSE